MISAWLTYLVHWLDDPVDSRVPPNGFVLGVNENDFEILVGGILINPVGIENSKVGASSTDTFFGSRLE
jgi:hypothetical protein